MLEAKFWVESEILCLGQNYVLGAKLHVEVANLGWEGIFGFGWKLLEIGSN